MLEMSAIVVMTLAVIVFAAALVQASIGVGLGMLAGPVLTLADADFVPVAIMIAVVPLTLTVAWGDRRHIAPRDVGFAVAGRLPGVVLGAYVVAAVSDDTLALVVAGSVLFAVAASIVGRIFTPTRRAIFAAGVASGVTGTAAGVGGPPIVLVYQHANAATMRATMSAFFGIGALMSITALAIAGEIGARELELTAFLLPPVLFGTLCARLLRHRLNPAIVRPALLAVCTLSAVALIVETL